MLRFWFEEHGPDDWFAKSDALDAAIVERFEPLRARVLASGAAGWRDDPMTLLAAVVLLDQFSRNAHRGTAAAYAADPLARDLTMQAIDHGWDTGMTPQQRQFLYLPLMHAEDRGLQAESLRRFGQIGLDDVLAFARDHAEVIERFGRFPSRNAALGRESTAEELAYLSQPGAGW